LAIANRAFHGSTAKMRRAVPITSSDRDLDKFKDSTRFELPA
jgi:hypothetical protein